ncbi:hypothetical protein [Halorussus halobius]|uniref:hypothetical protein n=1 Tax=Halorussus halobius TaxID=1710537 RepID=UPI001092133D|nr:hypothetical protein [Halorussus halobius]
MTDDGTAWSWSDLHDEPWSVLKGAYVRVQQEVDDRDPLDPHHDDHQDRVTTEEREGRLVGRATGTGLYYDSQRGEPVPENIGPAVYLNTREDTILEVRTDNPENELLAFQPKESESNE